MENEVIEESHISFNEQSKLIYSSFKEHNEKLNTIDNEALNELLSLSDREVDIESYVQIMYMKGKTYEKEDNRNGARYCAMRLLWMQECYTKPKKKRPRYLDMIPYTFEADVLAFIHTYTDFLSATYRSITRKLQIISIFIFLIVFVVLALLGIAPLIAAVEAILLCVLNYWIQMRRMPDMFQKNQTSVIEQYVETELQEFDLLYRIS